jgi:hypothetical protein
MDESDQRRRAWIGARELTPDQYMLVNFGHSHAEWQDNVDEARRDEIKERVTRAANDGLLASAAARDVLDRLKVVGDPTALETELDAAGIPDIYLPRIDPG